MQAVQGGGRLPPEYQEVEWVANTDSYSAISSGFTISGLKAEIGFIPRFGGTVNMLCGTTYASNAMMLIVANNSITFWGVNNSLGAPLLDAENHVIISDGYQKLNDTEFAFANRGSDNIFYLGGSGTQQYWNDSRWTYCRIYKNNVLERDFVPCYRIADDRVGFYDVVSKEFYTSSGRNWVKGADVV